MVDHRPIGLRIHKSNPDRGEECAAVTRANGLPRDQLGATGDITDDGRPQRRVHATTDRHGARHMRSRFIEKIKDMPDPEGNALVRRTEQMRTLVPQGEPGDQATRVGSKTGVRSPAR